MKKREAAAWPKKSTVHDEEKKGEKNGLHGMKQIVRGTKRDHSKVK